MPEDKVVAAAAVQFRGSFAPDLREDSARSCEHHDWGQVVRFYFTNGWDDISIWKSALAEAIGSACLCYLSGAIYVTIGSFDTKQAAGWVGLSNIFTISLFIYALAPASGGHINPLITFATVTTNLTGFSRGVLYMIGQLMGAALAGGLIRGSFGPELTELYHGGGCYLQTIAFTEARTYLIEVIASFILLFLSFGLGLDPRQAQVFGPKLGPVLVACSVGLITFATVGFGAGYPGAQINPGRCFAFAVARKDFQYQWIYWVGPFTGAILLSIIYHIAPPYHHEERVERQSQMRALNA